MSAHKLKIGVIGAGIIGTSSALALIESMPNADITLISEKFSPNTTSDGSGGLIYPYLPGTTSSEKVSEWMKQTTRLLEKHFRSPNAAKLGIGLLSVYYLFEDNESHKKSDFGEDFISYRKMTDKELKMFGDKWKSGEFVTTYYAESSKMLPFFLMKFKSMVSFVLSFHALIPQSKGGKVLQMKINSLEELIGKYDIVVNCPGVEASRLVGDERARPIRGQVYRVSAPWIKHAVLAGKHYVIPNSDTVVLGGTAGYGDWNRDVNPNDSADIMEGCCQLFPSLRSAKVIREWVGLRPGRDEVRLERQLLSKSGKEMHVVHNYGHGGCGVTLFWGCAQEVVRNVNQIIDNKIIAKL